MIDGRRLSDLPPNLVVSIAERITYLEDLVAFSAACKSWRSKATKETFIGEVTHQIPILMIPRNKDEVNPLCYIVTRHSFSQLNLPEHGYDQCLSSQGWLLIASDHARKLTLLHPLNHTQIELPRISNFRSNNYRREGNPNWRRHTISKFVLSSSPSQSSDYIVTLIYESEYLVICRPGENKNWDFIRPSDMFSHALVDLSCFNGECYYVNNNGIVSVVGGRIGVHRV